MEVILTGGLYDRDLKFVMYIVFGELWEGRYKTSFIHCTAIDAVNEPCRIGEATHTRLQVGVQYPLSIIRVMGTPISTRKLDFTFEVTKSDASCMTPVDVSPTAFAMQPCRR